MKAKEPSLLYYLLIVGERIYAFILFSRALAWSETHTALSQIWTIEANSISYVNNCYIKCLVP